MRSNLTLVANNNFEQILTAILHKKSSDVCKKHFCKHMKKALYQNIVLFINNKICCYQNNNVVQQFKSPTES